MEDMPRRKHLPHDVTAKDIEDRVEVEAHSLSRALELGDYPGAAFEVPDPQAFRLRYELDDAVMQDGHTGDIIFTVADLIARPSRDTTLLAGTLIPTSTPAGVGFTRQPPVFLAAGDRVNTEIEGMVPLTNPVEAA